MESIVPTVYGSQIYNSAVLDLLYYYQQYSTINEALSINSNAIQFGTQAYNPILKYIAIGNGGHKIVSGNNGIGEPEPIQHLATDANLFNILPFVIVPQNNDLSSIQQANYALKTSRVINNISYFLYYLKIVQESDLVLSTTINSVTNGQTVTQPFVPSLSNIYPTPSTLNPNQNYQAVPTTIKNAINLNFNLSSTDIQYFQQVCQIVPEAYNIDIISEIALCTGVFDDTLGDVIGVQPAVFINTFFPIAFNLNQLSYQFSLGNTLPLYQLTNG